MNTAAGGDGVHVGLPELIAQRLRARRIRPPGTRVSGHHAAVHESRFRGRGVDYVESRAYQPGDDIRQMDWRVTARSGRPHTKVFQEEREHSVLLLVDCNETMRFGTRRCFKSVQAARAAALLAWSTVQGGDRVGAIGFGAGVDGEVRPAGGPRGALRVLRALVDWDACVRDGAVATPLSDALQRARRLARPGSRVILISDGFSSDAAAQRHLAALAAHCDVAAVLVSDPLELSAPAPGRYALHGSDGEVVLDFHAARTRAQWAHAFQARRARLLEMFERRGLRCATLDTRDETDAGLLRHLGVDARRDRRERRA